MGRVFLRKLILINTICYLKSILINYIINQWIEQDPKEEKVQRDSKKKFFKALKEEKVHE